MPDMRDPAARTARNASNPDIVLAFDFGARRIGIAAGNRLTGTAAPLTAVESGARPPWAEIDAIVRDYAPGTLVVGIPEASTGRTSVTDRARRFAHELAARYAVPVETVDETLTSRAAESELRDARRSGALGKRVAKGAVDARAAKLIAEQWLGARAEGDAP
jgi:putative Holliday junction resolvase